MTTAADLISTCERHLLAGDREQLNRLTSAMDDTQTTMTFDFELDGIAEGAYVSVDLEVVYVWSVDETTKTATIQRGMVSTVPAAHAQGTIAYVNPKFSKFDILNAINVELDDISPELFAVKTIQLTTQPVSRTYPLAETELLQVLEAKWIPPGAEFRWYPLRRGVEFRPLRNLPLTGDGSSPTGLGVHIEPAHGFVPGRPITVTYATMFGHLVNLTDDVTTTTGLVESSVDIPPLGAAARLMGVREAKRTFVEAEVDTRRAGEVPPGAMMRAAQFLYQQCEGRIRSEAEALRQQWPMMR